MAVLDTAGPPTAIHALLFESRRLDESQPKLIGISLDIRLQTVKNSPPIYA